MNPRAFLALSALLCAALQGADNSLQACAVHLSLPRSGHHSIADRDATTVVVEALIRQKGNVEVVSIRNGSTLQQWEVRTRITESKFKPTCSGKRLELIFTFIPNARATSNGGAELTFHPPNHFVLRSDALVPVID